MDSSKLLELQLECMEKYKSKWRPRDASEITLEKHHQLTHCCNYHKRTFPIVNNPLPYAPIIQSIQPDNESLIVFFLPPPSFTNCGCIPPIINYEYSTNGIDHISTNTISSPITIRGLTNGTTYSITLRAVNSAGQGPPSNSVQGTPRTVPGQPTIISITPGNQFLSVYFTPPSSTGGSPITAYKYSTDASGYATATNIDLSNNVITIPNITNDITYPITIKATNAAGDSIASNSEQGTPRTLGVAEWATQLNVLGTNNIGYSVQKDPLNNIYTAGSYISGSSINLYNMDGTQSLFTLPNTADISGNFSIAMYLIKYDVLGQVIWATYLNGSGNDIGYSLATDASNNVYITGTYNTSGTGSLVIKNANGSNSSITLPNTTTLAVFLIKYDPLGQVLWATILDGSSSDTGYFLAIDINNVYICGQYANSGTDPSGVIVYNGVNTGPANSNPSNVRLKSTSNTIAAFLIKYTLTGQAVWATNLITNVSSTIGYTLSIDASSNIYISGQYIQSSGTLYVQNANGNGQTNSTITLPITGSTSSVFLIKYDPSGQAIWATILNGTGSDVGYSLVCDSTNNVYITGQYTSSDASGNVIVYNGVYSGSANANASSIALPPTSSNNAVFLIKYDTSGQAQWATYLNGTGSDTGYSLAIDSTNNVYIAGGYISSDASGNVIVYNRTTSASSPTPSGYTLPPTPSANYNMFLIKYDSTGLTQWATCINPIYNVSSNALSIMIDTFNTIYITGGCKSYDFPNFYDASGTSQSSSTVSIPIYNFTGSYLAKYNSLGQAQSVSYLQANGQDTSNYQYQCRYVITDSSNNVYITGQYRSNTILYLYELNGSSQVPTLFTLPGSSSTAIFLIKYNSSGKIQWATYLNPNAGTNIGISLATDQNNNVYITGQYTNTSGTLIVQNASGYSQTPTNPNIILPNYGSTSAVFLIKYNASGHAQWATVLNGTGSDIGYSLTTDILNNVYITGQYIQTSGVVVVYNGVSSGSANASDSNIKLNLTLTFSAMFLIKYDASGQAQWATYLNNISGSDIGYSLITDISNNVYITGQYYSYIGTTTIFDASGTTQTPAPLSFALPSTSTVSTTIFLIKYNSSGKSQWATIFNGNTGFQNIGYSLTCDSANNIYITGQYNSSISTIVYNSYNSGFSTPPSSGITLPPVSSTAAFLIKYDASGIAQWATYLNGTGNDTGYSLARDSTNNIYITGTFNSSDPSGNVIVYNRTTSTTPPPSSGITLPSTSSQNAMFFIKYDASGIAQWATYLKTPRTVIGYSVAIDSSNKIYVGGIYYSPTKLSLQDVSGNTQTTSSLSLFPTPISNSGTGAFLIKYS